MKLTHAIDQYLRGYFATHERSDKTVRAYTTDLRQFSAFLGPRRTLRSITPEVVEAWAHALRAKGCQPTSIRRKLAALRSLCNYWTRRRILPASPFWRLRLNLGSSRVLPKVLTADEVGALLREAHRRVARQAASGRRVDGRFVACRDVAIMELLFATGVRVGELVAITLDDVASEEKAILIRGKGRRQRLAFLLAPQSLGAFEAYLRARARLPVDTRSLFVNRAARQLSPHGVAAVLRQLAEAAGITRRVTPHMIRHTVATLLLRNGADLRVVQEFLGHASIVMTQRYTQVSKEQLIRSLAAHHPRASLPH